MTTASALEATDRDAAGQPPTLRFADGIPGFPDHHEFVLGDLTEDGTFQHLTSVADPDVSLVVALPWLFCSDYAPDLPTGDERALGIERPEQVALFCAVNLDDDGALVVNLRAPFVANVETHEARQIVLSDDYPLRARVPDESSP